MAKQKLQTDFDSLKRYVSSLYAESVLPADYMVSRQKQEKELGLLQDTLMNSERFYFVVNVPEFKIESLHGIKKWLGYNENDFSLKTYWDKIMHPSRKASLLLISQQLYYALSRGVYPLGFMVQRFATLVPLKHYNGHYVLARKTSSVFQYDKQNRLVAYMDEFTIINHEYDELPLNPVMYNSHGERELVKEQEIMRKVLEHFLQMKIFSSGELQAIRLLAYSPGITQAEIAAKLKLSTHTINTYCKRFHKKAKEFYGQDFSTVLDAAVYLKREGLL